LKVFQCRVLGRIFGSKREEASGGWRELHSEDLRKLYASPYIINGNKSRKVRWAGYIAGMG
jgi:hypothetical protein